MLIINYYYYSKTIFQNVSSEALPVSHHRNLKQLVITHFANPEHQEMELNLKVAVMTKKHMRENYALPIAS